MEQTADPGEIVLSAAHGGTAAVGGRRGRQGRRPPPALAPGGRRRTARARARPSGVRRRRRRVRPVALAPRLGQGGGESEHRLASVGFVKFSGRRRPAGRPDGPDRAAAALDAVVRSVQDAAHLESVTFLASDIDANGGKIILTTGVP